jgi:hypothetical protein
MIISTQLSPSTRCRFVILASYWSEHARGRQVLSRTHFYVQAFEPPLAEPVDRRAPDVPEGEVAGLHHQILVHGQREKLLHLPLHLLHLKPTNTTPINTTSDDEIYLHLRSVKTLPTANSTLSGITRPELQLLKEQHES